MSEGERQQSLDLAARQAGLPAFPLPWTWSDAEIDLLRKACAARFDEDLRTESLMTIAATAIRIAMRRGMTFAKDQAE